jgi:hypothetical protein
MTDISLTVAGDSVPLDTTSGSDAIFSYGAPENSGTGGYGTFLATQSAGSDGTAEGFNSDESGNPLDTNSAKTESLAISSLEQVTIGSTVYYVFRLDLNESPNAIALNQLKLFTSAGPAVSADFNNTTDTFVAGGTQVYTKIFDLDQGEDRTLLLTDHESGSGRDDYSFLVPVDAFGTATGYVTFYADYGGDRDGKKADPYAEDGGFDEWAALIGDGGGGGGNEPPPAIVIDKVVNADGVAGFNDSETMAEGTNGVTYRYTITADSGNASSDPLTVTSLNDDKLDAAQNIALFAAALAAYQVESGDAGATEIVLAAGESITFDFGVNLTLNAGESLTNTVTVHALDDEALSDVSDDDTATVTATDVAPVIDIEKTGPAEIDEGGEDVTWHFKITNNSVSTDPVTITSLGDDKLGDLLAAAEAVNGGPIVLASGASFEFDFNPDGDLILNAGATHINTVTVTGVDDDGTEDTGTDDHTITAIDVAPVIDIEKTGPAEIDEGGEDVTWHFKITNNSVSTDPVTITSLGDDKLGDLLAAAEAVNGGPIVLASGTSFEFDFNPDGDLILNAGATHINTVTVTGVDDDGTEDTGTDDHTITATNVAPAINIEKTVDGNGDGTFTDSEKVQAFGDNPTYKYVLTNTSPAAAVDPLTVQNLVDDRGTLSTADDVWLVINGATQAGVNLVKTGGDIDALLEQGETWTYTTDINVNLNPGVSLTNTAKVTAVDDENTTACDTDTATVTALTGPGVRTPGFWSNLGLQFWDGKAGFSKTGPNFPDKELAPIGAAATTYLILGGNHDTVLDSGEIQVTLKDALSLINASEKLQQDGRFMLARDVIATELNLRAGNPGTDGDASTVDPQHLLDDAVAWLRATTQDHNATLTVSELTAASAVKTNSTGWNSATFDPGIDHSASYLHVHLDEYNNYGTVNGILFANDGG